MLINIIDKILLTNSIDKYVNNIVILLDKNQTCDSITPSSPKSGKGIGRRMYWLRGKQA